MSLSKKNLDKLNKLIKNKNFKEGTDNIIKHRIIDKDKNDVSSNNQIEFKDPNKIFYSLIDNSETLNETSEINQILRDSEINQINKNSKRAHYSKKLTIEEELYDEFNYLLDE